MYNFITRLISLKMFTVEYSIDTIKSQNYMGDLTVSHVELFNKYEFDLDGWKYLREDSRINEAGDPEFVRIQFVNPDTREELTFTWEDTNEN